MVRLREGKRFSLLDCESSFNSNMVRLRAKSKPYRTAPPARFNSNMVRLRVNVKAHKETQNEQVSIPIWCD
ncbi:hypothetical protein PORCAN_1218 [Porphyromonas crevioricanis JCM 13913]|nr:hypothetical protein PORCAN_1218 [Porphyromonas crevioricanis JCM 13913]